MPNSEQTKNYLLILAIIIVIAGIIGSYWQNNQTGEQSAGTEFDIRQFTGNVVSIEGQRFKLRGVFSASGLPEELSFPRDLSFRVNESTRFEKMEIQMPTWEELRATGATSGSYEFKDLPRTKAAGSLEDLKSSLDKGAVSVKADFEASVYNATDPVASLVFYQLLITSPSPQPAP